MANFLQLAQRVAGDSGTVQNPATQLTTVIGQINRLGKIVRWTAEAWRSIQLAHNTWRWMATGEFSGSTVDGQQRYDSDEMGIVDRFGNWIYSGNEDEERFSVYDPSIGLSDEGPLRYRDWGFFYRNFVKGDVSNEQKPLYFSIDNERKICFSPIPDKVYTVRGPYRKSLQDLAADADIPECPSDYHDVIVQAALEMLGTHDEAVVQIPLWRLQKIPLFNALELDQLPRIGIAGALA